MGPRDDASGEVGSRQVYNTPLIGRPKLLGPLWVEWRLAPDRFMSAYSDSVTDIASNYSGLVEAIDALTSGCWGTVNLQKEIVDRSGRVQQGQPLGGFEFVADRALNGSNVQNNFTVATDDEGKATLHYPTTSGVGSMRITENQRGSFKLYEQTVSGRKTLARCTAVDRSGNNVGVSYGSGNGIVVTSDKSRNAFTLSGVGEQHRVTCTVQNTQGEPKFAVNKQPFGDTSARVITGQPDQTLNVEYLVTVSNTGTSGGQAPDLREKPSAPAGLSVASVVDMPEGSNSLVSRDVNLRAADGGEWILNRQDQAAVDAGQQRTARIVVTYRVNNPSRINRARLTCSGADSTKGLFNHVELDRPADNTQRSDACVSATQPGVELKKQINNADADTKEQATSIMPGTNQVQVKFEVKNTGTTPLTQIRLEDSNLDPNTGAKRDAIAMRGLTCQGASVADQRRAKIITPRQPLGPNAKLTCVWNAQAPIVPAEGEYHGDRAIVLASYNLPGNQGGTAAPVRSENDAWVFKLPVAVGVLPDSGGHGHNLYLLLGGVIAGLGALWAYRRRA